MSLCISVAIPEGIVVAGESRQTQIIAGVNRISSDSAVKVFQLSKTVLAATAGWAFLQSQGSVVQRNISSLVESFRPIIPANSTVQAIATQLWTHFNSAYQNHIAQLPNSALPAGQVALNFIVAGYDPGSTLGQVYTVDIPSPTPPPTPARTTENPGPWWIGQVDVVARIVNGFDFRILDLPLLQPANQAGAARQQLSSVSYAIFWNSMSIQDAIDFAVAMIQVTTTIQKFTAGISMQLGGVAGVGGPIDVAIVRPNENVTWIARKEFHS
jgi:hypothetical protein